MDDIKDMFSRLAPRYDRANTAISFGLHHHFRRRAVNASGVRYGDRVLDVACGTGDLAFAMQRVAGPHVTGCDFSSAMLDEARKKGRDVPIAWRLADALDLPFANASFDVACIGYGLRNVLDLERALLELQRVLRRGGRLVVLETGSPRFIVPLLGRFVSGDRDAYRYLQRSASRFPRGEAFAQIMREHFDDVLATPLLFGASYLYVGVRP